MKRKSNCGEIEFELLVRALRVFGGLGGGGGSAMIE